MYKAVFFDIDNTLLLKKPSIPEQAYTAEQNISLGWIWNR